MTARQVFSEEHVLNVLKDIVQTMSTQKAAADKFEVNPDYFSMMLSGKRRISKRVLAKLGFERVVAYKETMPDWRDRK